MTTLFYEVTSPLPRAIGLIPTFRPGGILCQRKKSFSATARRCFHLTFHSVTTSRRNRFVSASNSTGSFSRLVRLPVLCTATGFFRLDKGASSDEHKNPPGSPLHFSSSTSFRTFNRAFSSLSEARLNYLQYESIFQNRNVRSARGSSRHIRPIRTRSARSPFQPIYGH